MSYTNLIITAGLLLSIETIVFADEPATIDPRQTVAETERAFADTMARRDFAGFKSFLSNEAVFFSDTTTLRGRQQVADAWEPYFKEPMAPFSWQPDQVEVLDSGTLALSTGPVYDSAGKLVGRFNSIWRLDEGNQWSIIFDKGSDVCDCQKP